MTEGLSPTPEEEVNRSEGEFANPEAQAHAEAVTTNLPLYEAYYKELKEKYEEVSEKIRNQNFGDSTEGKMKLDWVVLSIERDNILKVVNQLKDEVAAIEGKDEEVHDLINNWRQKLDLPLLNDSSVEAPTEKSE